jgi:Flp pilus assembly protein TadD
MNRFVDAIAAYAEAIARNPQATDAIINQGIALARSGNISQAIANFQRDAA